MGTELPLLEPEERVLSTLNRDGSRRWLRPRLAIGRFWHARRIVAYALIALFVMLPHVRMWGKPPLLIDLGARELTLLGTTFLPSDTALLAFLLIGTFVTIFLLTALFGRVWCGWACPQTVYMEFVFRPLERLWDRPKLRKIPGEVRQILKFVCYLLAALFVAHTFLAYFVGSEQLFAWMQQSPLRHPTSFLIMLLTTGLMLFNFGYFREQTCIVACPYGRLQSVMLDRDSLVITYDEARGEPAGRSGGGDCIDCKLCATVCPTGIDIRNGLQLECIGCAQCIDACDAVMDKLQRPRGLIRYASQANLEGRASRWLRGRVLLYAAVLTAVGLGLFWRLGSVGTADVLITRGQGSPFLVDEAGQVRNALRLKLTNRSNQTRTYQLELLGPPGTLRFDAEALTVAAGDRIDENLQVIFDADQLEDGRCPARFRIHDGEAFTKELTCVLIGPHGAIKETSHAGS